MLSMLKIRRGPHPRSERYEFIRYPTHREAMEALMQLARYPWESTEAHEIGRIVNPYTGLTFAEVVSCP